MQRSRRYAVAILVGVVVTGGVATTTPRPGRESMLLLAIALVYVVGTAIVLRYPRSVWFADGNWASAAFAGVLTFAGLSLLQGVEGGQNLVVAVLGWGLAVFGFVAGVAFQREQDADADAESGAEVDGATPDASDGATSD